MKSFLPMIVVRRLLKVTFLIATNGSRWKKVGVLISKGESEKEEISILSFENGDYHNLWIMLSSTTYSCHLTCRIEGSLCIIGGFFNVIWNSFGK